MRVVYASEAREVIAFAERAARCFAEDPKIRTYTDDGQEGIKPGCLFAVRWGCHERAVLVLRLDELFEPVIFGDIVPAPSSV